MSKAYPSNLSPTQFELLSDLIPSPKSGGRPRTVDIWEVLNAIFACPGGGGTMASIAGGFSRLADGVHQMSASGVKTGRGCRCTFAAARVEQNRY